MKIGDKVYVKHVQIKGENKKLQLLYDGPYRIIRVIPEESIAIRENGNVRRTYPLQELDCEEFVFLEYANKEQLEDQEEIDEEETASNIEKNEGEIMDGAQGESYNERIG